MFGRRGGIDLGERGYDIQAASYLFVTGASRGIGKAIAVEMARHGARVVISSRKADACDVVAKAINAELAGAPAIAIPAHIGERAELERLVAETRRRIGPIDVLVCNAAVNPYFGPSKDIPDSAFDKIMSVNIRSNHWLAHLVLPEMVERKDGVIIVVSSVGGLRGSTDLGGGWLRGCEQVASHLADPGVNRCLLLKRTG